MTPNLLRRLGLQRPPLAVLEEDARRIAHAAVQERERRDDLATPEHVELHRSKWLVRYEVGDEKRSVVAAVSARTGQVKVYDAWRKVCHFPLGDSPQVVAHQWGSIAVEGYPGAFKDVLLGPSYAMEWDWRETETHHDPGITEPVVDLLASRGAEVVVLSRGVDGVLLVPASTVAYAESLGLTVHVELTPAAIDLYDGLAGRGVRVGAALHSTC